MARGEVFESESNEKRKTRREGGRSSSRSRAQHAPGRGEGGTKCGEKTSAGWRGEGGVCRLVRLHDAGQYIGVGTGLKG